MFSLSKALPFLALVSAAKGHTNLGVRDSEPNNTWDVNTTPHCTWWLDYVEEIPCNEILAENLITSDTLKRWNPSLGDNCSGMKLGHSYCVEAAFEPPSVTSSTSTQPTSSTSTTTLPSNGIATPTPTQPGMTSDCNRFYFVKKGDICDEIAASHSISTSDFLEWNTKITKTCGGLWADAYVCVGVIGSKPTKPTQTPTVGNGIATPSPIQPKMVEVCSKFHMVSQGESCDSIAAANGISSDDFAAWNRRVGSNCAGLWSKTWACVDIIRSYNFDNGMQQWINVDGDAVSQNGALTLKSPSGGKAYLDAHLKDFTYRADVVLSKDRGNAGFIFRATKLGSGADRYRGYYAGISAEDGGYIVLGRADNNWKELGRVKASFIKAGKLYKLKVRAIGSELSVFVDDLSNPKFTVHNGDFKQGLLGVRSYAMSATFDRVEISTIVSDSFERNLVGWTIHDGGFDARTGAMVASNVVSGKISHQTRFADLNLEADIKLDGSNNVGNAGFMFRVSSGFGNGADAYSGYFAGIGINGDVLLGAVNRNWKLLARKAINIRKGQTYRVKVRAVGDKIEVYVDNMASAALSVRDGSNKQGVTGVRVYKTGAVVDNFSVQKL